MVIYLYIYSFIANGLKNKQENLKRQMDNKCGDGHFQTKSAWN